MYSLSSKVIATGVISLALLAASPAFADSTSAHADNGLHLGVFARLLNGRADKDNDEHKDIKNATSTVATHHEFKVEGSVTAINGSTITLQGAHGAVYTVNAANAAFTGNAGAVFALGSIKAGDKVTVTGSLNGSVITATKVRDRSDTTIKPAHQVIRSFEAGIVTAINGATVTLSNFGSAGTSTVTTNSATKYSVNGATSNASALAVGSHVLVIGTSIATSTGPVNASIIVVLTEGLNWIKHLFR